MIQGVNLEIMEFVEQQILPRYNAFGKSHGIIHAQRVIKNSIELAKITGADMNMAYVIAGYHDLGMEGPRAVHHITSGKILMADTRLRKWFTAQQLQIMKEAVEDHRASSSRTPRSIYGKIVAEADRDLDPEMVFSRAIEYGMENYPEKNKEEQWQRFYSHMKEKYGRFGYIRLWISNSSNAKNLEYIRAIIGNESKLREVFELYYKKINQ
ncbi:HD domain-containing protein [Prevotella brunnea]|uniref:HD domain-containing protein n=1 Tax=Prevotella brunnea TaxID=2508867 RepID=A0A5C8GG22_9BACT|nr:HD domain-containing protein [Prevotella brunnea]TXJ60804.1 HD domain-containing protein [Prevotella brunnea]